MPVPKTYAVYDTKDNDLLVGLYTSRQLAKTFKIGHNYVYTACTNKHLVQERYRIEVFEEDL